MNRNKRPLSITILGWMYVAVGTIGFAYHFIDLLSRDALHNDAVWVELTEMLAIISGAFLLRGHNWARWVGLAWIAFHVLLSAFNSFRGFAIHALFFAIVAWFLFRPPGARYFRGARVERT